MAKEPRIFEEVEDVATPREALVNSRNAPADTWWRWFWNFRRVVNANFETIGVDDFASAFAGRLAALEEEIRQLRLREMVREIDAALADVPPAHEFVLSGDVAPAREAIQPADVLPTTAERVPDQIVSVSDVEEIRQRVAALEGVVGAPVAAIGLAEALEVIREQAVGDALSLVPSAETGQLFRSRQIVQFIDTSQMYLPVTQPAAGPNIYETVVNGSAWRCFEFAPGTLAADNDNVEFIITPPLGWDTAPVAVRFIWTHSATVTNFLVAWRAQAGQYIDSSSGTAALSAENANVVQDIGGTTDSVYISVGTAVTPANVTPTNTGFAWSPLLFRVGRRNNSEGATGLAINARLLGVALLWGIKPQGQT